MRRHIDQLHHGYMRDAQLDDSLVDVQALCHNHALWGEILEDQVVVMEIGQLAKHLEGYLGDLLSCEGFVQVSKMVQIVTTLVDILIHNVDVIMRMENVKKGLNSIRIKSLQLRYLS